MSEAAATAEGTTERRNHPVRGVLYLLAGIFAFSLHDVALKWVSGTYPLTQVLFIRTVTAILPLLLIVGLDAGTGALRSKQMGLVLIRAALLLVGYLAYYMGFAALSYADAVALYMSVPLIILMFSGPLLGERVGFLRGLAVLVGFAGVVIMLRPGAGVLEPGSLLILVCATLYSLGMVLGRRIGAGVPASVIAFITNLVFLAGAVALGAVFHALALPSLGHRSLDFLVDTWVWPKPFDLLLMVSCGVSSAIGVAGLTFAYRETEANLVATFEYTALVLAVAWGYAVFGEVPTETTLLGAGLIVGAGLVALYAGRRKNAPARVSRPRPTARGPGDP